MANSRFEYVRQFERSESVLPNTWMVIRVDGNGFSHFVKAHNYKKPVDQRGVNLMEACALSVCRKYPDIRMAFGQSDEFRFSSFSQSDRFHVSILPSFASFVLPRSCALWKRREAKFVSTFASCFASSFVFLWPQHFPDQPLQELPTFDARCICLPSDENVRDYLAWRQADTHINHLLNICFWTLVGQGLAPNEAQKKIDATNSSQKHELLFEAGINYNNEPEQWRKGIFLYHTQARRVDGKKEKRKLVAVYTDIIADTFWRENEHLLTK